MPAPTVWLSISRPETRTVGSGPKRFAVLHAADAVFEEPANFGGHDTGFTRWGMVGEDTPGAVHTDFGICRLQPGGSVEAHVHSYEETFYILRGELTAEVPGGSFTLAPGDYGLNPTGTQHRWRNNGDEPVEWAQMLAPQPRAAHEGDTYWVNDFGSPEPTPIDVRDPRTRRYGHIDPENMDVDKQTQDRLALSASMRTALLVYSGITVKMMADTDLGTQLQTMFMVQYEPDGFAGAHDHPFEETYLILDGGVDAVFDGETFRLETGDIAFAGVGCVHEFANPGTERVRWLETQAPAPPPRHSYRFARDWKYLKDIT
ncbi:MAG: cupin domain-containing protein [Acidimicrobiia bacterium]|nr:cupin domain-containing protein [Acidimicrobiia bacterium]